jgi:inositol transport system substrate-binding protein
VYRINVTEQAYEEVRSELQEMYLNKEKYRYNYFGPICCFLGLPVRVKNKYFCSQFVAEMLGKHNIVRLAKPAALYHPRDIADMDELELVYEGKLSDLESMNEPVARQLAIANG